MGYITPQIMYKQICRGVTITNYHELSYSSNCTGQYLLKWNDSILLYYTTNFTLMLTYVLQIHAPLLSVG